MHERIAATYERFGAQWARETSPLYAAWAAAVAADPVIVGLLAALPAAKQQPNLLFAAARWEGAPLVAGDEWRNWLIEHWTAVEATALARTVQTNEPNRCATLLPAFAALPGPLALLEVGASAGLCLLPDRYGYEYSTPDGLRRVPARDSGTVVMDCRLSWIDEVPSRVPEVVWRRGIDLSPVDVRDADAVRWLENLVWPGPDHDGRVARLRGAAAVAASDPPEIVGGDLVERLEDVAATSPADATLVVFHSAVLMYLDEDGRRAFRDRVAGLGRRTGRHAVWISQETSSVLGIPLPPGLDTSARFVQSVDGVPVALAGQHGATYERLPGRDTVPT